MEAYPNILVAYPNISEHIENISEQIESILLLKMSKLFLKHDNGKIFDQFSQYHKSDVIFSTIPPPSLSYSVRNSIPLSTLQKHDVIFEQPLRANSSVGCRSCGASATKNSSGSA
jgi:hypothetical protein